MLVIILIIGMLASYGDSEAAIYKYKDANGTVLFTDTPVLSKKLLKKYRYAHPKEARVRHKYSAVEKTSRPKPQVCSTVRSKYTGGGQNLESIIDRKAAKYNIDPHLVKAVIKNESAFNSRAVSSKGALGLMQLMPQTAVSMGVYDAFDPAENIDGGAHYLSALIDKFGSVPLALAAYNAGPSCVQKTGGIPRYPETEYYVQKVLADYNGKDIPAYLRTSGRKALIKRKTTVIYKIIMHDGTVLYTNDSPSGL